MPLSHYLKIYPWDESPGQRLLYSTKRASKILISEETFQSIENGSLSPSDKALLSRLGMLVDDREEEKQAIMGFFDALNANNSVVNITVVLNLDCNFACVYCFEGEMKGKLYMSEETADHLVHFIQDHFTNNKNTLVIDFYGGEPLLSLGLIQSISRPLKSFTESRGASYRFTLVTNGSLFKRRVAEELVPLGLSNVQITLDGPAENHNRYRPFKSGAGSFETILRNIQETCDLVKVAIGGNFDRHNYEAFVSLLDDLEKRGLTPDRIAAVKFAPVMNRPEGDRSPADYREGCMSINEPWLLRAEALLREEILKRHYNTPKAMPVTCMIGIQDSFVVNYDGAIYKCPAFVGREGFAVGDIETGINELDSPYHLDMWKNEECLECEYVPLCFGGCRYMTFIRNGNINELDCKKSYLDSALEALVKQDIKYRSHSTGH